MHVYGVCKTQNPKNTRNIKETPNALRVTVTLTREQIWDSHFEWLHFSRSRLGHALGLEMKVALPPEARCLADSEQTTKSLVQILLKSALSIKNSGKIQEDYTKNSNDHFVFFVQYCISLIFFGYFSHTIRTLAVRCETGLLKDGVVGDGFCVTGQARTKHN